MASISGNQEIARRYAKALFDLADEQKQIDRMAEDMRDLSAMILASKEFSDAISNVAFKRGDQLNAMLALSDAAQLSPLTRQFLGVVVSKGRLASLPAMILSVQEEIARRKGEVTAHVTSVSALDATQTNALAVALQKALGVNVKVVHAEDASLMGGLVVRVGSKLIDASVRTKLERLTRVLKSQDSSEDQRKMKEVA